VTAGLLGRVSRTRLSVELAAGSALLTIVVIAAAFLGLSLEIRGVTKRFFADALRRNQGALLAVQHRSLQDLLQTSTILTENPTLRAAIQTYRSEPRAGRAVRTELIETIRREAEGLVAGLGKDLLIVTDDQGQVLASRERRGGAPAPGTDLSGLADVRRALDPALPGDSSGFGIERFGDAYFQAACVPIVLRGYPIGTLILGDRLGRRYVQRLRDVLGGDVAVTSGSAVIATTLSDSTVAFSATSAGGEPSTMRVADADYVVATTSLGAGPAGEPIALHLLQPLAPVLDPLDRALLLGFFIFAAGSVLLVGLGTGLVGHSLLRPLGRFVDYMGAVAATGDPAPRFDATGAAVEIETLNATYNRLMDSLEQKRMQVEQANAQLQNQIRERERVERALGESEAQLRQSQKLEAVGTLAGGVAHDFNNLLTVILSYADLLLREAVPGSATRADLVQVKEAAARAATMTKQLLAFSRRQVLQPKVIDLSLIVEGIRALLRRMISEDIELRALTHPPLARVKADPGQIEQVLMNLAVNARDAMPAGGVLTIETANETLDAGDPLLRDMMPPGPWVRLSVHDTGLGMDQDTQARIFEPFFTTKDPGKGTGLGLSTVYGIVKQSGGFVWVSSAVGAGTTFDIYLPPVEEVAAPPEAPPPVVVAGSETILLVEDEAPVRGLARRCLEGYGYRVLEAGGSPEAVALAARHTGRIDLLLTDVVMPQGSGRELAERLGPLRPDMRVLYMSGYTDDGVVRRTGVTPGSELLEKPFTPDGLARRVRQVLDRAREGNGVPAGL
jgi:signal transduction histidine kinase/CheY-like chemotaxis protein